MTGDPAPGSVIAGELRWATLGDLIGAFGALARAAGALATGHDDNSHATRVDELIIALGDLSAAVDFAVGFLGHDQRSRVRERARDSRNKMQHTHWDRFPEPPA